MTLNSSGSESLVTRFDPISRLRDSEVRGIKKARTRKKKEKKKKTGRKLFSRPLTFRLPFTFASSPLSESLEQATGTPFEVEGPFWTL